VQLTQALVQAPLNGCDLRLERIESLVDIRSQPLLAREIPNLVRTKDAPEDAAG
jgi:hypothetical protein